MEEKIKKEIERKVVEWIDSARGLVRDQSNRLVEKELLEYDIRFLQSLLPPASKDE